MHLVNSAFDLLVTLFLCIILLLSLNNANKNNFNTFCSFFFVQAVFKKWSELSSKRAPSCLYKVVRTDLKSGPILH